jgi:hypothetical protein
MGKKKSPLPKGGQLCQQVRKIKPERRKFFESIYHYYSTNREIYTERNRKRPQEMKNINQWVVWRGFPKEDGKLTKKP